MNIIDELDKHYHDVYIGEKYCSMVDMRCNLFYNPYFIEHFNNNEEYDTKIYNISIIMNILNEPCYNLFNYTTFVCCILRKNDDEYIKSL